MATPAKGWVGTHGAYSRTRARWSGRGRRAPTRAAPAPMARRSRASLRTRKGTGGRRSGRRGSGSVRVVVAQGVGEGRGALAGERQKAPGRTDPVHWPAPACCSPCRSSLALRPQLRGTAGSSRIAWSSCPKVSGYQCGTLRGAAGLPAPIPAARSSWRSWSSPSPQSKGVIVFNPGGPGESGVLILPILASLVPAAVKDQFTLVSFDERGTGSSEPLLCGPSAAAASSAVAGTAGATRTFAGLARLVPGADARRCSRP